MDCSKESRHTAFENKGEAVGVTLPHPHGQIYAYPFVPPRMARKVEQFREYKVKTGKNLIASILENERKDNLRIVAENDSFTALIPFFARYPYELHIYPNRRAQALTDFSLKELKDLATVFKQILTAFDKLFEVSFPYIMAMNNRPLSITKGISTFFRTCPKMFRTTGFKRNWPILF